MAHTSYRGFRDDLSRGSLVDVDLPGGGVRRARLSKHAPYRKIRVDGWYVSWVSDRPRKQWESAGGWQPTDLLTLVVESDCDACGKVAELWDGGDAAAGANVCAECLAHYEAAYG